MPLETVSKDLRTYLQNNFTAIEKRAYLVATEASYLLMETYKTPGIGIVYTGGDPDIEEQQVHQSRKYTFDINIYQTVWKEEKVIEGDESAKGLFELQSICQKLIEEMSPDTDFTDPVYLVAIEGYIGTNEWIDNAGGLSAWIGLKIVIKEQ